MADWSELDDNLLVEIGRRIVFPDDFIAFSRVCRSWRSAAIIKKSLYDKESNQMPLLMLPPEKGCNRRGFFSLSHGITRLLSLPQATAKKCFSSKGWLLTIAPDWSINLLHPFFRVEIKLPHIKRFSVWEDGISKGMKHAFFINKFVLSSNPLLNPDDYTLMVTYGSYRKFAYFKPGARAWTTIDTGRGACDDGTFYEKDKFYIVNCQTRIFVCDTNGDPIVAHQVAQMPYGLMESLSTHREPDQPLMGLPGRWYVVGISAEGEGEILCVVRRLGGESTDFSSKFNYRCTGFQVFRVELSTNSWTMVKDIGNIALFLGHSSSFCIKADISRCIKANCIYFTDDCQEAYWDVRGGGGKDTGIYNIHDDTFLPYSWGISCNRLNPPMWIEQ